MVQKITRFIHSPNSLKSATLLLAFTLFLSNVLGVIRDHYLAQKIPADILDTYFAAFRLPDLIFNVLILGAVSSAFIPVFTDFLAKSKRKEAFELAHNLMGIGFVLTAALVATFYALMPFFVNLLVPSFPPEKILLTISNARVLLLSPLFFGFSFVISGMLNSWKRFVAPSLAPLFYNGAIIIGTILFADQFSVRAVVWSAIVGALLHLLVQIPTLFQLGYRPRLGFDFNNSSVKKIGRLMVPRAIGLGANQMMLVAFTFIASGVGAGSIAIYNFADNIQTTPVVIFATSLAQALFPTLAEHYSLKRTNQFAEHVRGAIEAIIFILIPMGVGMVLLRAQIVRLILGSGYFGWEQTIEAARTLGFFGIGLVFAGVLPVLQRAFFAMHNTRVPAVSGVIAVIASIIFGFAGAQTLGVAGLALGYSLGMIFQVCFLYYKLSQSVVLHGVKTIANTLRVIIATIIMAIAVQGGKIIVGNLTELTTFVAVLAQTVISTSLGLVTYFIVIKLVGHPGLPTELSSMIFQKIFHKQNGRI